MRIMVAKSLVCKVLYEYQYGCLYKIGKYYRLINEEDTAVVGKGFENLMIDAVLEQNSKLRKCYFTDYEQECFKKICSSYHIRFENYMIVQVKLRW